jgi:hypothetical protein
MPSVSNLPRIRKKKQRVDKPPTPDKNDATKPGIALQLNLRGKSCHIGKFTDAADVLPTYIR